VPADRLAATPDVAPARESPALPDHATASSQRGAPDLLLEILRAIEALPTKLALMLRSAPAVASAALAGEFQASLTIPAASLRELGRLVADARDERAQ